MKKILFVIICISITTITYSQQQVQGSDFESWNQNHYNSSFPTLYYWEVQPTAVWASSNAATTIVNNFCMQQTTDKHSGSFAAYLETKNIFGQVAAGNLFTGYFIPDMFNSKAMRGIPFTSRPADFRGYFKYTSVPYTYNSVSIPDSCAIYAILSKWNGSQRIEVGKAELFTSNTTTTYNQFIIPFNYNSGITPDTISVVFASSKNGEFFRGGIGSKLYIDDISFSYLSGIDDNKLTTEYVISQNNLTFNFNKYFSGDIVVFDMAGRQVFSHKVDGSTVDINISDWNVGVYCYMLSGKGESLSGKISKQ